MYQLTIPGVKLPKVYVCQNKGDIETAKEHGLPWLIWRGKEEVLVKLVMLPVLRKMFPDIEWIKALNIGKAMRENVIVHVPGGEVEQGEVDLEHMLEGTDGNEDVSDIAEDYRYFDGTCHNEEAERDLLAYCGTDQVSSVEIEQLQALNLLPQFVGDIANCIRKNISENLYWKEGFNKKTKMYDGVWKEEGTLPNLIILDVSGSIPRGVSSTMLALIETLRDNCNADLIITAGHSEFYPFGTPLPDPQTLRNEFGYGNECEDFYRILRENIAGREFGHVISFGDNDAPAYFGGCDYRTTWKETKDAISTTKIHALHNYHTKHYWNVTGYLLWAKELCPDAEYHTDSTWCSIMKK